MGGGWGMLKLRFDRYITDTGTDFILVNANACNQEALLVCEVHYMTAFVDFLLVICGI